jgi:hypothetical protein
VARLARKTICRSNSCINRQCRFVAKHNCTATLRRWGSSSCGGGWRWCGRVGVAAWYCWLSSAEGDEEDEDLQEELSELHFMRILIEDDAEEDAERE